MKKKNSISIKSNSELKLLREAGKILADVIKDLKRSLKSGMTTQEVDIRTEALIRQRKVIPAFKGYRGFPGSACISINQQVVHGIPGQRRLKDGDIVSIDVGIIHKGYYSDTAVTAGIGSISRELQRLLEVTQAALKKGIEQARPKNRLSNISYAIQKEIDSSGFSIVRDFVGHGIGKNLHEDPEIPNFGQPNKGPELKVGMVFAIEPMVNMGGWKTKIEKDGWTVVTQDGKPSAHFEHTVAITENGPEILTK
ncbi:Methionine aminopeptidase [hydrothermal vent metagenome]|uniref:Methionine aminopeptidase n=1 Tax=hydrothermal vent metagenome TaxID=652676 RepID=A0A3B1DE82_9ZZZZ